MLDDQGEIQVNDYRKNSPSHSTMSVVKIVTLLKTGHNGKAGLEEANRLCEDIQHVRRGMTFRKFTPGKGGGQV